MTFECIESDGVAEFYGDDHDLPESFDTPSGPYVYFPGEDIFVRHEPSPIQRALEMRS